VSAEARLASFYEGLAGQGLSCLVMGGHAVRHYGVDRSTLDFDLHLALDDRSWRDLATLVARIPALAGVAIVEGPSWRPHAFRRFVVGRLPDGREERLEFWRRNHLLAPFDELWARREVNEYGGRMLSFLGLDDLIRSKETEREDDWRDVAMLEEIADERRLARAPAEALTHLRSRRGFELAVARGLLGGLAANALPAARDVLAAAYLAPWAPSAPLPPASVTGVGTELLAGPLRTVAPGSARHLALVEAVRRLYRRAAMATDRADKERSTT
jgi:hypothetical protein